jgi:hypothetical protein
MGCGGESTRREPTDAAVPGPVRLGKGAYDLFIRTLADDCAPAFVSGEVGLVTLFVNTRDDGTTGTVNFPFYGFEDGTFVRDDANFPDTSAYTASNLIVPPCDVSEHYEFPVTRLDGERIDVGVVNGIDGVETCSGLVWATQDCSASRIFQFTWRRACVEEGDPNSCE